MTPVSPPSPNAKELTEAEIWEAWCRHEGRCPFCIEASRDVFKFLCDCWQYEKRVPR